ncbi:transposase [Pokkaliibacter plantistimulans]|uniref:Transposase n=1 Tax=Pokkaliibacter plantistimulans TaxID=1635171 RepID=A0ABX5M2C7_9GAMM|nr:transposase [Pokkaliibacter plantistimulans]
MNKPASPKYKTTNWKSYNAALKARGSLMIWLDRDMTWLGQPRVQRRRPPVFIYAAI